MSARELTRVEVLSRVKAGTLSLGSAATLLAVSYRQAKRLWQHHPPILLPFSPAHRDLPPIEIDVLDAQFQ